MSWQTLRYMSPASCTRHYGKHNSLDITCCRHPSICGTPCGRSLISLPWPSLQPLPWQASSWQACLQLQRAWQEPSLPCLQLPWAFSWALCRLGLHHPPPLDAAKLPVTYILQIKGRQYAFFFLLHSSYLLRASVCHTSNSIPAWLTEHALFCDG